MHGYTCPHCGTQDDDQVGYRQVPASLSANRPASIPTSVVIYCQNCGHLYDVFSQIGSVQVAAQSVAPEAAS